MAEFSWLGLLNIRYWKENITAVTFSAKHEAEGGDGMRNAGHGEAELWTSGSQR